MTYLISILIFIAVFFLVMALSSSDPERLKLKLQPLLADEEGILGKIKEKHMFNFLLIPNKLILRKLGMRETLYGRLTSAKIKLYPEEFFGLQELAAVASGFFAVVLFGKISPLMVVIAVAVGFFAPDVFLKIKINNIKEEISKTLPDVVDLLALCVGAGLSFNLALKWVTDKSKDSFLINELQTTLKEINVGRPKKEALNAMAKRLNSPDIARFVRTIIQSEKMGTSVGEALAILSEDARLQRYRRGERIALKAPIKMLFPLIFCIMPVVVILIAAPIFLKFSQGGFLGTGTGF